MAEKTTPFVINDRRKFTSDGELRQDSDSPKVDDPASSVPAEVHRQPAETIEFPSNNAAAKPESGHTEPTTNPNSFEGGEESSEEDSLLPAPSTEQLEQAARAYAATVDRLDTAIRASNPGADRIPEMSFDRFVQSVYMQAIMQLGGGAEPGQQPQIDIIGARQTIDMLAILDDKTRGNLGDTEERLLKSALFEAQIAFLEITQAIARQSAGRHQGAQGVPGGGPSIVR